MQEPRRQGERHREESFIRARLECAVLDYLDQYGPVDVATIAAALGLPEAQVGRLVENFRRAEVVLIHPMSQRCALAPA